MQDSSAHWFVIGLFWIAGMAAVKAWLARSRLAPRPPAQANQVAQPRAILALGIIGTAMFGLAWLASLVWPDDTVGPFTHAVFLTLTVLSLALIADHANARHTVDSAGMAYGRMLGQRGSLRWSEVERVGFNRRMNWYRLELACGATVRVSGTSMGLPAFARHVLEHVPAQRIDRPVLGMLALAAQGKVHP